LNYVVLKMQPIACRMNNAIHQLYLDTTQKPMVTCVNHVTTQCKKLTIAFINQGMVHPNINPKFHKFMLKQTLNQANYHIISQMSFWSNICESILPFDWCLILLAHERWWSKHLHNGLNVVSSWSINGRKCCESFGNPTTFN
jgi:hypothetical protein